QRSPARAKDDWRLPSEQVLSRIGERSALVLHRAEHEGTNRCSGPGGGAMSNKDIKKVTRHVNQNEGLIFERSSPGKKGYRLPPLDVPAVDPRQVLGEAVRHDLGNMPEVSEMEIIRHFTRISTWNYAIDLGMYPLGSCTMKYNARVNEVV